jgi:hypothetical protein
MYCVHPYNVHCSILPVHDGKLYTSNTDIEIYMGRCLSVANSVWLPFFHIKFMTRANCKSFLYLSKFHGGSIRLMRLVTLVAPSVYFASYSLLQFYILCWVAMNDGRRLWLDCWFASLRYVGACWSIRFLGNSFLSDRNTKNLKKLNWNIWRW